MRACAAEALAYSPLVTYSVPRHLARTNRVTGGMLLTSKHLMESDQCSLRFQSVGAPCHSSEVKQQPYGNDAVRPQRGA